MPRVISLRQQPPSTKLLTTQSAPDAQPAQGLGPSLLNSANAQNTFKDPEAVSPFGSQSQIQQFTDTLQRAILSRIASAVSGSVVDANGNLIPGTVTIGSISVTVVDLGTTLRITTIDSSSGQTTTFEIPK